jgi:hypothetical protein
MASLIVPLILQAQDSSSTPKQIWPELDVYYRVSEKVRFYGMVTGTRSNSEFTDGTIGVYMDYFAIPWLREKKYFDLHDTTLGYYWWFRTGYSYSNAPPGDKKKVVNIFETETNNNFHLPEDIVLQTRNRLDWRWVNGDFQPIYRPRIKLVRNFKTAYLTFNAYIWSEYFFYLNDNSQDKLRLTFGSVMKVTKNLDLEVYYLHQFPNHPGVEPLDAIGLQLDCYFRSRHYRQVLEARAKTP